MVISGRPKFCHLKLVKDVLHWLCQALRNDMYSCVFPYMGAWVQFKAAADRHTVMHDPLRPTLAA